MLYIQCTVIPKLGMTVHWIDSIALKLDKAALACKRVRGKPTNDVIACEIDPVHTAFGPHKVTACVTAALLHFCFNCRG